MVLNPQISSPAVPAPALSWVSLRTVEFVRWCWQQHVRLPHPLMSAAAGQVELPIGELLGAQDEPAITRPGGEQVILDAVRHVLGSPSYAAYAIRSVVGGNETYYTAYARETAAVLVTDTGSEIRLSRVDPTLLATSIAGQFPRLLAAPIRRIELPAQTAATLAARVAHGLPEQALRLTEVGVPAAIAARLLAGEESVRANGAVGALRFVNGSAIPGTRAASWTEMGDGGMMSYEGRNGTVVWEPLSVAVLVRAVADAMASLGA